MMMNLMMMLLGIMHAIWYYAIIDVRQTIETIKIH